MHFPADDDILDRLMAHFSSEQERRSSSREWLPAVPSRDDLGELMRICFAASLEQDEGRKVTFKIFYDESWALDYAFASPPKLTPKNLAVLSAAVDVARAYICVWRVRGDLSARGIAHLPITYPSSLTIRVVGPGVMIVLFGARLIFTYRRGEIVHFPSYTAFNEVTEAILPTPAFPGHTFGYLRVALTYLVKRIIERGHGGTLLTVPRSARWFERVTAQRFAPSVPGKLAADAVVREAEQRMDPRIKNQAVEDRYRMRSLSANEYPFEFDLDWLAQLAGADGITVVDESLDLLGFGVFFKTDRDRPFTVTIQDPFAAGPSAPHPDISGLGGARHQSAAVTCAALPGSTAFVASQDGTLTAIRSNANGDLTVHKHLELTLHN